jgi:hypothetical protein
VRHTMTVQLRPNCIYDVDLEQSEKEAESMTSPDSLATVLRAPDIARMGTTATSKSLRMAGTFDRPCHRSAINQCGGFEAPVILVASAFRNFKSKTTPDLQWLPVVQF